MIKHWLSHPLTRGCDIDDPHTTHLRRQIIREKPFLWQIYCDWYAALAQHIPTNGRPILELGSGAGFLRVFVPNSICSEIFFDPSVDIVLDGHQLPFSEGTLQGIAMTNVLHHIQHPRSFFREAARCVQPQGVLVMIEPWTTTWSRIVYTWLHHEPFETEATTWEFPSTGPLSGANGALPWIIFARDRACFEQEFPEWSIQKIELLMPFRYLVSGGVSFRDLMPGWMTGFFRLLENACHPWIDRWAMFALIVLVRNHMN